jgi:hypothetical protein
MLEDGELLVELGDGQLRDPAGVNGRRLSEAADAGLGERHHDTTGVGTALSRQTRPSSTKRATRRPMPDCALPPIARAGACIIASSGGDADLQEEFSICS